MDTPRELQESDNRGHGKAAESAADGADQNSRKQAAHRVLLCR